MYYIIDNLDRMWTAGNVRDKRAQQIHYTYSKIDFISCETYIVIKCLPNAHRD